MRGHIFAAKTAFVLAFALAVSLAQGKDHAMSALREATAEVHALREAGELKAAIEKAKAMLAEAESDFGLYHSTVAFALNELAVLYLDIHDYDSAYDVLARALDTLGKAEVRRDDAAASVLANLGGIALKRGKFAYGKVLYDAAIQRYDGLGDVAKVAELRDAFRWLEPAVAAESTLADHRKAGRFAEAIPFAEILFALQQKLVPPGHHYLAVSLTDIASLYHKDGRFDDAIARHEAALKTAEAALGADHPDVWAIAGNLATVLSDQDRYAEAQVIFERVLAVDEAALPPNAPEIAIDLNNLAGAYVGQGQYANAKPLLERSLAIGMATYGDSHHRVGISLDNLGSLHRDLGHYAESEKYHRGALAVFQKTLGTDHPTTLVCLSNLFRLSMNLGRLDEAEALARNVLEVRQGRLGPSHLDTAKSYENLADVAESRGRFGEAEQLLQQSLAVSEKALGAEHQNVALTRSRLGNVYLKLGRHDESRAQYETAAKILKSSLGDKHPKTAAILAGLAELLQDLQRYEDSQKIYSEVLQIYQKAFGDGSPKYATMNVSLGLLEQHRGNLASARSRIENALVVLESAYGADSLAVATVVGHLGSVRQGQGDYAESERLFRRSLQSKQKLLGDNHPDVAARAVALAGLYYAKGDFAAAEGIYWPALKVMETGLGPDHPSLAGLLNDLGNLLMDTQRLDKAAEVINRALAIRRGVYGEEHTKVAQTENNLAEIYRMQGRNAEAALLYEHAFGRFKAIYGERHAEVAKVHNNIGLLHSALGDYNSAITSLKEALSIEQEANGPRHPQLPQTLMNLGIAYWAQGDLAAAFEHISRAAELREQGLATLLAIGSERHRLSLTKRLRGETDIILSFHSQAAPKDQAAAELALTTLVRRKGRVLDAMADTAGTLRRHLSENDRRRLAELDSVNAELSGHMRTLDSKTESWSSRAAMGRLFLQHEQLQRALSESSAEYRVEHERVELDQIRSFIPANGVLVELARYNLLEPKALGHGTYDAKPRYVAYLLAREGEVEWVDLGPAAPIDDQVMRLRAALNDEQSKDVIALARALDRILLQPIRAKNGTATLWLIAPDATLNLVPFAALVDEEGRYAVQRLSMTYLNSGRELRRLGVRDRPQASPVVLSNPNYASRGRDPQRRKWSILPRSIDEGDAIAKLLEMRAPKRLTWNDATETALREVAGPEILHLATHAYFAAEAPETDFAINPLLRSSLVLAGANGPPAGADDGLLTALELSSLDLWGTRLVVMSACETALGEVHTGEGVFGLRRALTLAGAESQVISLWEISSNATTDLMVAYYAGLNDGMGRADALRAAQQKLRATDKYQHPHFWAPFIPSGNWAPLRDGGRKP